MQWVVVIETHKVFGVANVLIWFAGTLKLFIFNLFLLFEIILWEFRLFPGIWAKIKMLQNFIFLFQKKINFLLLPFSLWRFRGLKVCWPCRASFQAFLDLINFCFTHILYQLKLLTKREALTNFRLSWRKVWFFHAALKSSFWQTVI